MAFEPQISFAQGVPAVMEWYLENKTKTDKRYNVFTEKKYL